MMLVFRNNYKSLLFYLIGIVLSLIPFFYIGPAYSIEFILNASEPALFILMCLFIRHVLLENKSLLNYRFSVALTVLTFYQFYSYEFGWRMKSLLLNQSFPVIVDGVKTVNDPHVVTPYKYSQAQYLSLNPEKTIFYTKLAKPLEKIRDPEIANYRFLLDPGTEYAYFQNGIFFYSKDGTPSYGFPLDEKIFLEGLFRSQRLVKPLKEQPAHASILSSHHNLNGFTVEQDYNNTNVYYFGYDYKGKWTRTGNFILTADVFNYLVINYDSEKDDKIGIYINGKLVLEDALPHGFVPQADALFVSDWRWLERKYNGVVKEIIIKNEMLPAGDMQKTTEDLSGKGLL
jgi:hypothetical protein